MYNTPVPHPGRSQNSLSSAFGFLGHNTFNLLGAMGRASRFLVTSVKVLPRTRYRLHSVFEQLFFIGNRSLLIVGLTAAFTGMVLTLQGHHALSMFGADQMVGALVALSLLRELGPVLAGLMVTARAGSAIAATLGNMRVTEQIDALETMAIDPRDYLVAPRLLAAMVAGPLLTALFDVIGLGSAYAFARGVLALDGARFLRSVTDAVEFDDVRIGLYKSLVFSVVMVWMSTYRGYFASGGAKGVGQATTRAVVETAVLILALDYVLTALLF